MGSVLEHATRLRRDGDRLTIEVPDTWQQGRGAFGGIALTTLARALEHAELDSGRSLRTFSADLLSPVMPGEAEVRIDVLRRGKHLSNVEARLLQDGSVVARGSGALCTARAPDVARRQPTPPPPADWRAIPVLPAGPPLAPVFSQHFEYRSASPPPYSGAEHAVVDGWIRERETPTRYDVPMLIGMLDVWWPSLLSALRRPIRVATTTFTAEILADPTTIPTDAPLRYRAHVLAVHEGFMVEFRELWSGDRLLAANQQTMVLG
jgi:hypothetical protein